MICPSCGFSNVAGADLCEQCMQDLRNLDLPGPSKGIQRQIMEDRVKILQAIAPVFVSPETSVLDGIALMRDRRTSCLLIMESGQLKGIFSERDALLRVAGKDFDLSHLPIGLVMTKDPATLHDDDTIAFALHRMAVGGFRHLPIVKDQQPIGIISMRNVLRYLCGVAW